MIQPTLSIKWWHVVTRTTPLTMPQKAIFFHILTSPTGIWYLGRTQISKPVTSAMSTSSGMVQVEPTLALDVFLTQDGWGMSLDTEQLAWNEALKRSNNIMVQLVNSIAAYAIANGEPRTSTSIGSRTHLLAVSQRALQTVQHLGEATDRLNNTIVEYAAFTFPGRPSQRRQFVSLHTKKAAQQLAEQKFLVDLFAITE